MDNELKTAALKKHANHKQTPREPEMPFKTLVDKIDQMDFEQTRTITNNHKILHEVNQTTTTTNISEDLKQMNAACNNINDLNQNDLEQFEGTICNILNGLITHTIKKNFKGRPKFALFCSYYSSRGHTKRRCFKRPRRESIARPKERSFYSRMRNNQNLPNRRIDSNKINGRQLPSTSPLYHNSQSRTPYRLQSTNNYNNNSYNRDNRNYQGYRYSNNNNNNNRSGSYNRNHFNRSRTNSYNRNNNHYKYSNSRSSSRYTNRSNSRQHSSYNRNNNNSYNNNNRQRHYSKDSNKSDRYRQRSSSNSRHYSNNNNRDDRRHSTQTEQNDRYHSKDRRPDGNKYNNNNKNRINNIDTERQNDDAPGIDDYEYTPESSNEDQEILDKFYNANEDTCNTVINTLESYPTWMIPMYKCNKIEQDFAKQKPILEIDFLELY